MNNRNNHTLTHSMRNCRGHIGFSKFRRKVFDRERRREIGKTLKFECGNLAKENENSPSN